MYLDNTIFTLQKAGGISTYWYEIIRRVLRDKREVTFIEQVRRGDDSLNILRTELKIASENIKHDPRIPTRILQYLPCLHTIPGGSVYHSSYYRPSLQNNIKQILTVFDFMYERYRTGLSLTVHHGQKKWAISKSDVIICISNNTKIDLLSNFAWVDESKVKVIHLAANEHFKPLHDGEKLPSQIPESFLKSGYLLYVGDRRYYKNFLLAVKAVSEFPGLALVAVGGGELSREHEAVISSCLPGRFVHLNRIDIASLNRLYNSSIALIYPSEYEGFGIPVVEAMQAGCPVIGVRSSSIPEIAGDACFLAPLDGDRPSLEYFCESIQSLCNPSIRQSVIIKGITQAKKFSWEKCYQETIKLYE